ncbi:MAG: hypothetical protein WAV95_18905 [Azonexus sp.]
MTIRHLHRHAAFAALLVLAPSAFAANNWEICELTVKVNRLLERERLLEATIIKASSKTLAECPGQGKTIVFRPETADYQNELPRRSWPQPGSVIRMRYQYLDGYCKESGPCRIEHYPVGRQGAPKVSAR